jgi:hypothetical protein
LASLRETAKPIKNISFWLPTVRIARNRVRAEGRRKMIWGNAAEDISRRRIKRKLNPIGRSLHPND